VAAAETPAASTVPAALPERVLPAFAETRESLRTDKSFTFDRADGRDHLVTNLMNGSESTGDPSTFRGTPQFRSGAHNGLTGE